MSIKIQMHVELQRVLNQLVWQELQEANGCTTQETISLRAAEKVLKLLRIDFTTIQNLTHCVRIHRHWSLYIRDLWNNKLKKMSNNNISADDNNAFERFMAKDYHKPADLYRFATVLMKRTKGHNKSCPYIFAMDGILGWDVKKYVKNLQYPPVKTTNVSSSSSSNGNNNDDDTSSINDECFNPREIHVNAIRSLYSRFHNVTVESVHRAVMKVIRPQEKDEENKKMELEEEENEDEGEENKLPHYYRQLIGDHILEIRQWLQTILRQQKQQEKQMKKRLRIRVSKKIKLEEEDEDEEDEEENDDDDENDDEST